ncbi:MAG: SH3 domain-containing protein [Blautia sp.]|nr:SH3 domain-containing protein [Blautia sp.]
MKHSMAKVLGAAFLTAAIAATGVYAQSGTITADMLNVRTGPSTSAEIVDALYYGDTVNITYNAGDWCEIYRNGDCYYINANYVSGGSGSSSSSYDSYSDGAYTYEYSNYSYSTGSYSDYSDDSESYTETSNTEDDYSDYNDYSEDETETYTETASSNGTYLGNFKLTAYCPCAQCCGTAGNATASGVYPTSGHTVAMGGIPFGTQLLINGQVYTVEDRGTPYGHVDIFFDSHSEALAFGVQYADVYQLN